MRMRNGSLVCLFLAILLFSAECLPINEDEMAIKTNRPIIGILAQNTYGYMAKKFGPTYIAASYIKYIELAGGRVVPIRNDLTEAELTKLFYSINGVLFPGGRADFVTSPYGRTSKILFKLAKKANDGGDVFPLWGTCLGFEFLGILGADNNVNVISDVDGMNYSVPLNLTAGYQSSRLFGSAPEEVITYLKTLNVTFNHHRRGISTETYNSNEILRKFYKCLSTNRDKEGKKEFVSTIEAYNYPFFGIQWHAEKNPLEWTSLEAISHSQQAVRVTQFVADFFVNQARQSGHHFPSREEETNALIYQSNPVYCDPEITFYEQCYVF